jgi:hypothetical protein
MVRIILGLLVLLALSACSATQRAVPADRAFVVGRWTAAEGSRTFAPDGTYCSVSVAKDRSVGVWRYGPDGVVSYEVLRASGAEKVTQEGLSELLMVIRLPGDRLLMGPECPHCPNGIAGGVYRRASGASCE